MTARATASPPSAAPPVRSWRGVPVVLPNRRDPRLHVSAVILSLQVLGQVWLGFKVSIAQIVVTIGVCAVVEVAVTLWRQGVLAWPASALLTGNGVAFILRTAGTQHGDWWSLNGIEFFILGGLLGLGSKYVIQLGGRHLYNPSNLGLVAVLLVVGPPRVFPQYLYWGDLTPPVTAALVVIIAGVVWILRPLRMLPMAGAFLVPFVALMAALAASGRCMLAIWHTGPICGFDYWLYISTSPELLVFVFYMMSDPKTAPRLPLARVIYGLATAVLATALIAPQPTEFGVKVALLAALVMVCSIVPLIEGWAARVPQRRQAEREQARRWVERISLTPTAVGVVLILLAIPVGVRGLAVNDQLIDLERGITPTGAPGQ